MVSAVSNVMPSFGSNSSADAAGGNSSVKDIRILNNVPYYWESLKRTARELTGATLDGTRELTFREAGPEITRYSFLGGTFLEKLINKHCSPETRDYIKSLDENLLDTKAGKGAVEKVFDCKITKDAKTGQLVLRASEEALEDTLKIKAGRLAADTLGATTKLGLGVSFLTETPNLYHAYEDGDLGKQTVRSTASIAASSVGFGIVTSLAKSAPAPIRTACLVGGAIIGSIGAAKGTEAVLDEFLGKSIHKQKLEAQAKAKEFNPMLSQAQA